MSWVTSVATLSRSIPGGCLVGKAQQPESMAQQVMMEPATKFAPFIFVSLKDTVILKHNPPDRNVVQPVGFGARLGLTGHHRRALVRVLRQELDRTDDRERLLGFARRWLYEHDAADCNPSGTAATTNGHGSQRSRRI